MQQEFTVFCRKQARYYSSRVELIVFSAAVLSFVVSHIVEDEVRKKEMLQTSFILIVPSLIAGIVLSISFKNLAMIELLIPLKFLGFALMMAVVNTTEICGEITSSMRQEQIDISLFLLAISLYLWVQLGIQALLLEWLSCSLC